jgi:DNA replication protein DnaC
MREYERDRDEARAALSARKAALYAKSPRLAEIEGELAVCGISAAKLALSDGADLESGIAALERKSAALSAERAEILRRGGRGEDDLRITWKCPNCEDTGFISGKRCACLRQKIIDKNYNASNLRGVLESENFDNFDVRLFSEEKDPKTGRSPRVNIEVMHRVCLMFAEKFDETCDNLILTGLAGTGKTFLCNCVAKELLDRGKTVFYATAPALFRIYDDYRFGKGDASELRGFVELAEGCDLLIIDDLGAEFVTSFTASELFNLVNTRGLNKKSVVISTNLTFEQLQETYTERITSRFHASYKILPFFGADLRSRKR